MSNFAAGPSGFYVLWICADAYAMRHKRVLDDNEWGWGVYNG
jgi:hypothetical protein